MLGIVGQLYQSSRPCELYHWTGLEARGKIDITKAFMFYVNVWLTIAYTSLDQAKHFSPRNVNFLQGEISLGCPLFMCEDTTPTIIFAMYNEAG